MKVKTNETRKTSNILWYSTQQIFSCIGSNNKQFFNISKDVQQEVSTELANL